MAWAAVLVIHRLFVISHLPSPAGSCFWRPSTAPKLRVMVCLPYSGLHTSSRCSPSDGF